MTFQYFYLAFNQKFSCFYSSLPSSRHLPEIFVIEPQLHFLFLVQTGTVVFASVALASFIIAVISASPAFAASFEPSSAPPFVVVAALELAAVFSSVAALVAIVNRVVTKKESTVRAATLQSLDLACVTPLQRQSVKQVISVSFTLFLPSEVDAFALFVIIVFH